MRQLISNDRELVASDLAQSVAASRIHKSTGATYWQLEYGLSTRILSRVSRSDPDLTEDPSRSRPKHLNSSLTLYIILIILACHEPSFGPYVTLLGGGGVFVRLHSSSYFRQ
ncbi:hypothetical protein TNCV_2626621 [Trichonephila clavipes]|uniref:Uncharacterized protein n=1 Tax=Trichonephila clavipes TaxID=2585209 RepID=A0A8X7BF59_TRICX|nr:hypothetical protein TNCV_2626621 [Trichonephila clavipes]